MDYGKFKFTGHVKIWMSKGRRGRGKNKSCYVVVAIRTMSSQVDRRI